MGTKTLVLEGGEETTNVNAGSCNSGIYIAPALKMEWLQKCDDYFEDQRTINAAYPKAKVCWAGKLICGVEA